VGPDLTTVLTGPVVVSPGAGLGAGVPGQWYITIPLTTPFLYDPNLGDITVDIYQDGTGWTGTSRPADHVSTGTPPSLGSRIYNTAAGALTATTGTVGLNYGAVTEFTYTPAAGLFAVFNANVTGGGSPLNVTFTDSSFSSAPGGVTSWAWDFNGDSVVDSNLQNPTHTYTACGTYTVSLTVNDGVNPPSTLTKTNYITTDVVTPSFTTASLGAGAFQFTDTSSPTPTSWAWDFNGDTVVDSTLQNPVWVFAGGCGSSQNVSLSVSRLCQGPFSLTQNVALSPNAFATTFVGGNGLSGVGAGNTFDITVNNPQGVVICAIDVAPYMATPVLGTPLTCTVWVTDAPGGYLANHANASVWRQVATGTGLFAGGTFTAPVPVSMALSNPIYVPAGTYGMAVHITAGSGVAYTNVTAPFQYVGTDITITAGNGKGSPFATGANAGRGWNGRLHYSTPTVGGLAGYGFYAAGCAGTLGIPHVINTTQPTIGGTLSTTLDNLQFGIAVMVVGLNNTLLDLTPLGAPGCTLRATLDATETVIGAGTTGNWNFNIPNVAALLGVQLYNQAASLDTINPFGFVLSDAYAWVVGN
jgi:PKD repeat protein